MLFSGEKPLYICNGNVQGLLSYKELYLSIRFVLIGTMKGRREYSYEQRGVKKSSNSCLEGIAGIPPRFCTHSAAVAFP